MDGFIAAISLNELVCVRQPTKFAGEPARLAGVAATSNFFRLLGTRMALGRNFLDEEDQPGRNRVALLSHAAWQQRLGGKPEVLGSSVVLNDIACAVVGVLPPRFELVTTHSRNQPDIWVPLALNLQKLHRGSHPLRVFGRIKRGLSPDHVQADLDGVAANLAALVRHSISVPP